MKLFSQIDIASINFTIKSVTHNGNISNTYRLTNLNGEELQFQLPILKISDNLEYISDDKQYSLIIRFNNEYNNESNNIVDFKKFLLEFETKILRFINIARHGRSIIHTYVSQIELRINNYLNENIYDNKNEKFMDVEIYDIYENNIYDNKINYFVKNNRIVATIALDSVVILDNGKYMFKYVILQCMILPPKVKLFDINLYDDKELFNEIQNIKKLPKLSTLCEEVLSVNEKNIINNNFVLER